MCNIALIYCDTDFKKLLATAKEIKQQTGVDCNEDIYLFTDTIYEEPEVTEDVLNGFNIRRETLGKNTLEDA